MERTGEAVSVLLADDRASLDGTLTDSLTEDRNVSVVGRAIGRREAVDLVRALDPEVVLLDVTDPEAQGIAAGRDIRTLAPETSVVVLTDSEAIGEASDAAAVGYVRIETVSPDILRLVVQLAALMNRAGP